MERKICTDCTRVARDGNLCATCCENRKKRRTKKLSQGLCESCGKKSRPDKNRCAKCAAKLSKSSSARRKDLLVQGTCPACGIREAAVGITRCVECDNTKAEYQRKLRAERKATGLCKECAEPSYGKTLCPKCVLRTQLRIHKISEEEYQDQFRRQDGSCACCGKPFAGDTPRIDHVHGLSGCKHKPEVGCSKCFRSLMHGNCNFILGQLGDNPDTVIQAMLRLKSLSRIQT